MIVVTSGVICKVQILHNYGRGWSRDLKKSSVWGPKCSGLKHSSLRLKWGKILEKKKQDQLIEPRM